MDTAHTVHAWVPEQFTPVDTRCRTLRYTMHMYRGIHEYESIHPDKYMHYEPYLSSNDINISIRSYKARD
jgi:hypothetical protein